MTSDQAARRTRKIVRTLAAGTWSALSTYGALIMASYGYPEALDDIRERHS